VISSTPFPHTANDHLQNAQLAANAAASFLYATQHPHSTYVSQALPATTSPYATIASYHPTAQPPTIIPPPTQPLSLAQIFPTNTTDIQQQQQQHQQQQHQLQQHQQQQQQLQQQLQSHQLPPSQQQAPILTSPKHDASSTKHPAQQSTVPKTTTTTTTAPTKPQATTTNGVNTDTLKIITAPTNPTQITDLLSSSPSISNPQLPPSLLSPITVQTTNPNNVTSQNKTPAASLNDLWPYTASGSPLNLSQAAAQTAVATAAAAMGLLNNESNNNTEMANEILKELTTPTKQNK
jgi:hypothetical protein